MRVAATARLLARSGFRAALRCDLRYSDRKSGYERPRDPHATSQPGRFTKFRIGSLFQLPRTVSDKWCRAILLPKLFGARGVALVDQAIVSGASFATIILLSHGSGPDQIGVYSIGISILVTYLGVQDSLVSLPYTIQQSQSAGSAPARAGDALAHSVLWSAIASGLVAAAASVFLLGGVHVVATAFCALAGAAPFALLREFCRRFAFAHLQMTRALILDAATAAAQLSGLCWLGWSGKLASAGAYTMIGVACALTSLSFLFLNRMSFIIRPARTWRAASRSWRVGKWLLASQTIVSAQNYVTHWLLALTLGAAATGVYAACASIVMIANPVVIGIGNTVAPRAARALRNGGATKLREEAIGSALLLGGAMSLVYLALLLVGDRALGFLFHGDAYAHRGPILESLGLSMAASAIGLPALISLASIGRPQAVVRAGAIGLALNAALVCLLAPRYGVLGASYGPLIGNLVTAIGLWTAFLKSLKRLAPLEICRADQTIPDAEIGTAAAGEQVTYATREELQ